MPVSLSTPSELPKPDLNSFNFVVVGYMLVYTQSPCLDRGNLADAPFLKAKHMHKLCVCPL